MTIEHVNITDPNIHEPKGVNAAAIYTTYRANGAGTGSWGKVDTRGLSGLSGAGTENQSLVVDGAGGHKIVWDVSHGGIYFNNIGTPATITYPSSYVKITPTTVGGGIPKEFTEGVAGTLTYTGLLTRQAELHVTACLTHSAGADRDIRIMIYKNGVAIPSSEAVIGVTSAGKRQVSTFADSALSTNDYIEVYIRNDGASGDISLYTFKLSARAYLS